VAELHGPASTPGRPVLAPEVQLLGKSRAARAKDVADFRLVAGALDQRQTTWLRDALTTVAPEHAWLAALQSD
jgi:hypothetical protein